MDVLLQLCELQHPGYQEPFSALCLQYPVLMPQAPKCIGHNYMVLLALFSGPIQMLLTAAWVWEESWQRHRRYLNCLHIEKWNTSRNFIRKCFKKLYIQGLKKEISFSLIKITLGKIISGILSPVIHSLRHSLAFSLYSFPSFYYVAFFVFSKRGNLTGDNHAKPEYPRPSSIRSSNFPERKEFICNKASFMGSSQSTWKVVSLLSSFCPTF